MHDDYGEEPSWPVALVVGVLAFVVGLIIKVRDCLGHLLGRRTDPPPAEDPDPTPR